MRNITVANLSLKTDVLIQLSTLLRCFAIFKSGNMQANTSNLLDIYMKSPKGEDDG
ncbi:hypothetical protein A2U01_0010061 [Trifolium medium]|uniref:Uncharacterized protein n=1 Tax=Trifolium medium TaxID=97028 RepID=A0A392MR63_9FABA|nr:hypothetical protein [Trifolium medium]